MSAENNALAPSEIEANTTPAPVENEADTSTPEDVKTGDDTTGDSPAKDEVSGDDGEKAKKPNRKPASERIAELTKARHEAEKRAAAAEAKLKAYEAPKPKRSDFTDDDDFEAERAKWAAKAARGDDAKQEAQSAKSEAEAAKVEAWNAQREEISTRYADFDQVIAAVPATVFTQSVADAIMESDMAAEVAYVLAKDLPRARQFAAMTPLQMGREIGRIEAELAPKPRKLSSAPPPVETIGSGAPGTSPDPSKMSMAEYVKWRKSQKD
jgi:hypothetical protein